MAYEIHIKGSQKVISVSSDERSSILNILKNETIPNDKVIELGSVVIKKGDIKGIFGSEQNGNEESDKKHEVSKVRSYLNQLNEAISMKSVTPENRTNLSYLKTAYYAQNFCEITDDILKQVKEKETEFFKKNPEEIIFFDAKLFDEIIKIEYHGVSNFRETMSKLFMGDMGKNQNGLIGGYINEMRAFKFKTNQDCKNIWQSKFNYFVSIGGVPSDTDRTTGNLLLKQKGW